ncbi:SURF1 family cytochrome oxidase biogenesis protein [Ruicaihuangia caeni]|uniref:SURF1 family cytochrome oxidase biogenesis protein n=1 Tax=Ruicaihuangia caeni TaxID=3042517 RepID=UPI00338DF169
MWRVARRPKWIGVLVACLAVAAAFALLGQWQLERSFDQAVVIERDTETPHPIEAVTAPQQPVSETLAGLVVTVEGSFVAGDFVTLTERLQHGEPGDWLVGHFLTTEGASLAVAVGWQADDEGFDSAADELVALGTIEIEGRYLPSDSPTQSEYEEGQQSALAVAQLINEWDEVDGVYSGYVVSHTDLGVSASGMEAIDSPKPDSEFELNWLNIFYAIEWALFAVFAVYLWYRLVKDAWEREVELAELEAAEAEANAAAGGAAQATTATSNGSGAASGAQESLHRASVE